METEENAKFDNSLNIDNEKIFVHPENRWCLTTYPLPDDGKTIQISMKEFIDFNNKKIIFNDKLNGFVEYREPYDFEMENIRVTQQEMLIRSFNMIKK